jgi:hypothetical protein
MRKAGMQWWESKSNLISMIQEHITELKLGVVAKVDAS